jgi:CSLREA domain-containing protein
MKAIFLAAVLAVAPTLEGTDFHVNKTADTADGSCTVADCSLREAIIAANSASDADTIHIPPGTYVISISGAGEDNAATGDLDIKSELTILGDPYEPTVVDGGGLDRVFHIVGGVIVRLEWLTITNGSSIGGGGIAVGHSLANVTVDRCLVIGNTTTGFGGGLRNDGDVLYVRNTTVTDNTADQGGGLAALGDGTLALVFSTVRNNSATSISNGMQISAHSGNSVVLESTIIDNAARVGSACWFSNLVFSGHNIESPGHSCGLNGTGDMDDVTASSLALGPLAWNGGPTRSFSIGPASIAGNLGGAGNCPPVDQRGGPRNDGFCDIGSYELNAVPPQLLFRDGFESGGTTMWSATTQ